MRSCIACFTPSPVHRHQHENITHIVTSTHASLQVGSCTKPHSMRCVWTPSKIIKSHTRLAAGGVVGCEGCCNGMQQPLWLHWGAALRMYDSFAQVYGSESDTHNFKWCTSAHNVRYTIRICVNTFIVNAIYFQMNAQKIYKCSYKFLVITKGVHLIFISSIDCSI